jgi:hypothetical protein
MALSKVSIPLLFKFEALMTTSPYQVSKLETSAQRWATTSSTMDGLVLINSGSQEKTFYLGLPQLIKLEWLKLEATQKQFTKS